MLHTAPNALLGIFGLGTQEMVIIFVLCLLLFGAKKLPEFARGLGKSLGEFKKAREEFEHEIVKGGDDIKKPTEAATKSDDKFPG
jgi:sec-independent protein translocase protein TatA